MLRWPEPKLKEVNGSFDFIGALMLYTANPVARLSEDVQGSLCGAAAELSKFRG